ncbi:MAG: alpha/beta hydrolase [Trueperaceae bacterium]|nr:alpha/beta hydrolase [Trueperaceae bacterium]
MSWVDAPITVQDRDADLYVEQAGPQEAPVVLYLHGGPGYGSFSFRDLMGDELEDFRMLYADQRGGGRSYAGGPFGLDDLADDAATLLRATRLERATLLAHGFGALVAIRAAVRHQDRIERLVLVNPWFSMPLLARTLQRRAASMAGRAAEALPGEEALADPDALDPDQLVETAYEMMPGKQLLDALEFPDPSSRMRLEHADAVAQFGPQRHDAPGDVWRLSVLDDLAQVQAPLVALFGTQDGTSFPEQAEAGLARAPHATTGMVEGGHYPWLDDPEAFVPLVREALGAPRTPTGTQGG